MYEVWVDGSVRGNPGIGGVGVVVKQDEYTITQVKRWIGDKVTNNEAEYKAVIEGIKAIYALNSYYGTDEKCIIYTDSKVIYNQIVSGWKINFDHLRELNKVVKEMVANARFVIEFKEIRREENVEANDLAQACTELYKRERLDGRVQGS